MARIPKINREWTRRVVWERDPKPQPVQHPETVQQPQPEKKA